MPDFYVEPQMKENPFYYDGISQTEYLIEWCYYMEHLSLANARSYKPLHRQLREGLIKEVPEKYKKLLP